jgi:DNA-directed RNA polymerase specialized sigma24 family protein
MRAIERHVRNLSSAMSRFIVITGASKGSVTLMLLRRRRTNTHFQENNNDDTESPSVLDLADMGPTPEQALAETERCAAVAQAISHLRESLRIVVLLRELKGLTSAETARRLGLTVSAFKAGTFHARRCLRHNLERRYKAACSGFLIGTQNKE